MCFEFDVLAGVVGSRFILGKVVATDGKAVLKSDCGLPRRHKKRWLRLSTRPSKEGVFTPRTIPHRTPMGTSFKARDAVLRVYVRRQPRTCVETTPRLIALGKSNVPETSNHQRTGVWGR